MISVNPKFRQLITGDNPTRIRLYFLADSIDWTNDTDVTANGELLVRDAGDTDSNRRIAENGISLLRIANKDVDYEIGCAASYTLSITFLNDDGGLNNFNFARRCKVFLDVQDTSDSTWYSCPLGVFRFEKPVKQRVQLIEATGYDLMQELNVIADDWWNSLDFSGGLTIEQIISSLSAQVGFTVAYTGTLVNKALQFSSRPFDSVEVTYREIVEILAEVMGANARISAEGYLNFYEPYNQVNYTIDCDTLGNGVFSADVAEYTVSQIDKLRIMASDSDYGAIIGTGTNGYQIIDNPFLYGSSQAEIVTKATPIYNKLSSLVSYNPISVVSVADPSYEAGDRIIFVYKGTTYTMPIFQQEIAWHGGSVTIENTCTGNEKREVMTEVARSEYRGRKTVHEVEVTADTLASRINDFDGSGSTIEQTIDSINTEVSSKVGDDEIISKINQSPESVTIQANKVNLSGYVTFTNLATEGQTVINGGNITTGTIDAGNVNVTNINASNITTGTMSADKIRGGRLYIGGVNGQYGQIVLYDGSGSYSGQITGTQEVLTSSYTYTGRDGTRYDFTKAANLISSDVGLSVYGSSGTSQQAFLAGSSITELTVGSPHMNASVYMFGKPVGGTTSTETVQLLANENNGAYLSLTDSNGRSTINGAGLTTSKVTANGDGITTTNATVNGVLDITPRRCYATLSSAGWYRVMKIAGNRGAWSSAVDFCITRAYNNTNNEVHSIKMLQTYTVAPSFVNEASKSNALNVVAIRYTVDSDGIGYVDIRYDANSANTVTVDFIVHTAPEKQETFTAEQLQEVAASPSGETVLTEYSFSVNTNGDVTSSFSTSKGSVYAYRSGDMVTVTFVGNSTTWTEDEVFMTIADGIRPAMSIDVVAYIGRQAVIVRINQNGNIVLWIGSTLTGNQRLYFSATYPISH